MTPVLCPTCHVPMVLRPPSRFGLYYACPRWPLCRETHGAHPDGTPLGRPATAETREWRRRAHAAFDSLWQSGYLSRSSAYGWLRDRLGLTDTEAHIGMFDAAMCQRVIELVEQEGP